MSNYGVLDPQSGDVTAVPAEQEDVVKPSQASDDGAVANAQPVSGPDVVSAEGAEVAEAVVPDTFDGTTGVEDRVQADADAAAEANKRAEETKDVAAAQRAEDLAFATNNPDSPIVRPANPNVGGESF